MGAGGHRTQGGGGGAQKRACLWLAAPGWVGRGGVWLQQDSKRKCGLRSDTFLGKMRSGGEKLSWESDHGPQVRPGSLEMEHAHHAEMTDQRAEYLKIAKR